MASSDKTQNSVSPGQIARYTMVVIAIIAVALFFWQIKEALLAAFAGVIVAVILAGMARGIEHMISMPRGVSVATVFVLFFLFIGFFSWLFGAQIVKEFEQLTEQLPERITDLQETIRGLPLGEQLLGTGNEGGNSGSGTGQQEGSENSGMFEGASGMLFQAGSTIIDVIGTFALILFVGIFFAVNPGIYKHGIILLVTKKRQNRVDEALTTSGNALWQWLKGQLMAMAFVGIAATIGLMIIGVPLALILGVIAGLFDFVPIVGPFAAALPALLLAFSDSPQTALFTAALYLVIQQLEGNVITPLVQQKMVYLPPAVVILSVVAFGLVFGITGVILATPLAVVAMVLIGMLYVQDVLGNDVKVPGKNGNNS